MKKNNYNAFTLVELIVVITILAVLATVAFISFAWYSGDSRDSVRLTNMKLVEKSFWLMRTKSQLLPDPDESINITADGVAIWKQWFFWTTAFKSTSMTSAPKDPQTGEFLIYRTNQQRTKYQLGSFLENEISLLSNSKSFAADNWNKTLKVRGSGLWIMVDSQTNKPINFDIDVVTYNSWGVSAILWNNKNDIISGTGTIFKTLALWDELWKWLIWYWSFDESDNETIRTNRALTQNLSTDFSEFTNMSIVDSNNGKWLFMSGSEVWLPLETWFWNYDFWKWLTITFWYKNEIWKYNSTSYGLINLWNYWNHIYAGNESRENNLDLRFIPNKLYQKNLESLYSHNFYSALYKTVSDSFVGEIFNDGQYHLHTITYDNEYDFSYYIDDKKIYSTGNSLWDFQQSYLFEFEEDGTLDETFLEENSLVYTNNNKTQFHPDWVNGYKDWSRYSLNKINIWQDAFGIIDEIRIYDRKLQSDEVTQIYAQSQ